MLFLKFSGSSLELNYKKQINLSQIFLVYWSEKIVSDLKLTQSLLQVFVMLNLMISMLLRKPYHMMVQ